MPKFIALVVVVSIIGVTIYLLDKFTQTETLAETPAKDVAASLATDVKQELPGPEQHKKEEEVKIPVERPPEKEEKEEVTNSYLVQERFPLQSQVFEPWKSENSDLSLRDARSHPPTAMRVPRSSQHRTPRSQSVR